MISDEPDEDADPLDDDMAIEALLGETPTTRNPAHTSTDLPDWPPRSAQDIGLNLDAETLTWFRRTHTDWRRRIRSVLRAWVVANTADRQKLVGPIELAPPADG
jgi:uncharacterized protein (DUF4415 family)